jgi:hypothetical protein
MKTQRLALIVIASALVCARGEARAAPPDDTLVTLRGTVRMPDGPPAVGAFVSATGELGETTPAARTDETGRFELRGVFGNGARLYARSADEDRQTTRIIPALAVRRAAASPVELALVPAVHHTVIVRSGGRAVEGAQVVASGVAFDVHASTGPDGAASLRLPASSPLLEIVAWHAALGIRGVRGLDARPAPASHTTELALIPPGPLQFRVVDPDGRPVSGLELGIALRTEDSDWALAGKIAATRVRTDGEGAAAISWAPRENVKYVDPRTIDSDWKIDATDLERLGERIVTIHARRKVPVEGRLTLPAGVQAEGLFITGFGFGPGHTGDVPFARARADGSFRLEVASDHAYVLGVVDLDWGSPSWSGLILAKDAETPAAITLAVEAAAPLTVHVTRGPQHVPVADTWIDLEQQADVHWVDAAGKERTGRGRIGCWLRTDAQGVAQAGVGQGKWKVDLRAGAWKEERTIVVAAQPPAPARVEFHRPWLGDRQIHGRLLDGGRPFAPSPSLVARAWAPQGRALPLAFKPEVKADGTFAIAFDAERLSILFRDPEKGRSSFYQVGWEESSVNIDLVPTATYGGTLQDDSGQAMPDSILRLYLKNGGVEPLAEVQSGPDGRFRFTAVPSGVPLTLAIAGPTDRSEYCLFDADRLFTPGEARDGETVRLSLRNAPPPAAGASRPLADRMAEECRDARLTGLNTLLIVKGNTAQPATAWIDRLLDGSRFHDIWRYLPVVVEPEELAAEAATFVKYGCPIPTAGQLVLAVLGAEGAIIAAHFVDMADPARATETAERFLTRHMPPARDAALRLAAARAEARDSGRRVWVVIGGPRCGPCFRLGRWIDEHHATLEKDLVIVKVMAGVDAHDAEVRAALPIQDDDGIPWHAITEPDGTILATSRGPLGNIGFPASVEGSRHFRQMLEHAARKLTATEIDALVRSLVPTP